MVSKGRRKIRNVSGSDWTPQVAVRTVLTASILICLRLKGMNTERPDPGVNTRPCRALGVHSPRVTKPGSVTQSLPYSISIKQDHPASSMSTMQTRFRRNFRPHEHPVRPKIPKNMTIQRCQYSSAEPGTWWSKISSPQHLKFKDMDLPPAQTL